MLQPLSTLDRPQGDRGNAVGLVRFVLTSMVVLSHSFHFYGRSKELDPLVRLSASQYSLGSIAVDAYFILSGFLVARSWDSSRNWKDFLLRRGSRVYPGFFMAVAFSSFVAAPWLVSQGLTNSAPKTWAGLILPALVLDFRILEVNGSLWTIRYDFYYYLFLCLIASAGWFVKRWPILALWAVSWTVYTLWHVTGANRQVGFEEQHSRLLTCFLSGATFYAYRARIPLSWAWCTISLTVLAICTAPTWASDQTAYRLLIPVFPIFGSYVLLFLCFRPGRRAARFGWLGEYSYGLFLFAFPIQLMLFVAYHPQMTPYTLFLATWAIACVFSYVNVRVVERPVSAFVRGGRTAKSRTSPAPSPHFPVLDEARERAAA